MSAVCLAQRLTETIVTQMGWICLAVHRPALSSEHNLWMPVVGCSHKQGYGLIIPPGTLQVV